MVPCATLLVSKRDNLASDHCPFFLPRLYAFVDDSGLRKQRENQLFSWLLEDEGSAGARNNERPADCEFFGNNATCFLHSID